MPAVDWRLILEQGVSRSPIITYRDVNGAPIDLTNGSAYMQVRADYNSPTTLLDLSTANGKIVLGGVLGTITPTFLSADTLGIDVSKAQLVPLKIALKCGGFREIRCARIGYHDLYYVDSTGVPTRLAEGAAYLSPTISRPDVTP
jgi:hypothetical protein